MPFKKIYIHHYYSKILFYKLAHNTTDKVFNIEDDKRGSVLCKYNECNFEFRFDPEINDNEDGIHLIDFFAVLFQKGDDINIYQKKLDYYIFQNRTYICRS